MTFFYWIMAVLIAGTFIPSALFMLLYALTGEPATLRRSKALWAVTRAAGLFGINVLIWGHVAVGLWRIWFGG